MTIKSVATIWNCTVQDKVLRGAVTLDVPTQRVQYKTLLPIGNGATVAVTASCSVEGTLTSLETE